MNDIEIILLGLWKMAWAWIPMTLMLIGAWVYEWKRGIK